MEKNLTKIDPFSEVDGDITDNDIDNLVSASPDNSFTPIDDELSELKEPTNLDDAEEDKNYISYEERVRVALENNPLPPCSRDTKMDEKISKYSTYACIPFFVAGIVVTIFNKAKYRSPWSFLLIGLAVFALAVGAVLRYRNNLKCKCSVCDTQGKTLRSSAILWSILAIGCFIAFVVFLIINLRV